MLILHLNTKYCHASTGGNGPVLDVNLGRKIQQKLPDTYRVQFRYRVAAATPDYFQVDLTADSGPMGTKDYRIALEAVPVGASRTFLHLTYSYGFGTVGRMAMNLPRDRRQRQGRLHDRQRRIGRAAAVRRRRARAAGAQHDALLPRDRHVSRDARQPLDQRLARWFDATEQYPQQLHEVERGAYLQMKAQEVQRQQAAR